MLPSGDFSHPSVGTPANGGAHPWTYLLDSKKKTISQLVFDVLKNKHNYTVHAIEYPTFAPIRTVTR